MEITHLAYGAIILSLVAIIIVLLQGNSNKSRHYNNRHDNSSGNVSADIKNFIGDSQKTNINNKKYINEIKNIIANSYSSYNVSLSESITAPIFTKYDGLVEYINSNPNEQLSSEVINNVINFSNFNQMKSELEYNCNSYSNNYIVILTEIINAGTAGYNVNGLANNNINNRINNSINSVYQLVRREVSVLYIEIQELQSLQNTLKNMYPKVQKILDKDDIDIGSIAKNFGGGALAALMPLVGIPALIANFAYENKKLEEEENTLSEFNNYWSSYLTQWDRLNAVENTVTSNITESLNVQLENNIIGICENICSSIDRSGQDLYKMRQNILGEVERINKSM